MAFLRDIPRAAMYIPTTAERSMRTAKYKKNMKRLAVGTDCMLYANIFFNVCATGDLSHDLIVIRSDRIDLICDLVKCR